MDSKMNEISVFIDNRECGIIEALESDFLKKECGHMMFDIVTLEVGDMLFKYGEQVVCLIERKTIDDYASSITDKRLKNQSMRISQLRNEFPDMIVIYLIEGSFMNKDHKFRNGISRDSMYSSMVNRVLFDKFTIFHTRDKFDSALVITKIYDRLSDEDNIREYALGLAVSDGPDHTDYPARPDQRIEYLKTIKLSKKDNMTPLNCFVCQLSQIPGISVETADIISQQYKSFAVMIHEYDKLTDKKLRENMLSKIDVPIANSKTRHLGRVLSKRVYDYLFPVEKIKVCLKGGTTGSPLAPS